MNRNVRREEDAKKKSDGKEIRKKKEGTGRTTPRRVRDGSPRFTMFGASARTSSIAFVETRSETCSCGSGTNKCKLMGRLTDGKYTLEERIDQWCWSRVSLAVVSCLRERTTVNRGEKSSTR